MCIWVSIPVEGGCAVRRLNLSFFTEIGKLLGELAEPITGNAEPYRINAYRHSCNRMRHMIGVLVQSELIPLTIPASLPEAQALEVLIKDMPADNEQLKEYAWDIYFQATKLETLLNGELAVQSVYHIWPKRAYDTNLLISRATNLFSENVRQWFSIEEAYNISEAGKCLAFEVPTAAGFHLVRATESVIRRYYAAVVGKLPKPKMRNWGVYLDNLRKCGGDPKVIHALDQVKDLHRNPVIHPEEALTVDDALDLVGISVSVIGAIYSDMVRRAADLAALDLTPLGQPVLPLKGGLLNALPPPGQGEFS